MNRAGYGNDRFAFTNQLIAFSIARHLARISQARLNCFILFQIADILRRADEGGDHRAAERRLADCLHRNAIAGLREQREVVRDLFPISDGAIVTGQKTQNGTRCRNYYWRRREL